jgi:HEAT repeat protein
VAGRDRDLEARAIAPPATVSPVRRSLIAAALVTLAAAAFSDSASALVWPDVPARVERDLSAADPAVRRLAAEELQTLGVAHGTPLVIRALSDPDDEVRLAAADSAIRLHVTAASDLVVDWLGTSDARAKRKACDVLRAMPTARGVPPLARALGDPDPDVRQGAADALGASSSPDAVAPLLGKLDDSSPSVRVQIVAALATLADSRAVVPLVGKVQDSAPDVRQAVARALGALGDPRATQALLLQLRDANNDVRREAMTALGRLRAPEAVDSLAGFANDRTPQLRRAALLALGKIATKDAARVLIGALGSGDDAGGTLERTSVREALVNAGGVAVPQLHVLLEGVVSPHIATSAAWVLGDLHATAEEPTIIAAMRRGALPPAAALHALAGTGGRDAVPVVLEFVGDPSGPVRSEAIAAADALLDPQKPDGRAVEPIAAALRDSKMPDADRARLARILGRTGAPRAAAVLAPLTASRDPALSLAAIDALGLLGVAGADDALVAKLSDLHPEVRLHAAVALADSGGASARDTLLTKLDGGEEIDRTVLWTALAGILSRASNDASIARVANALDIAAGPERDAVLTAIGRASGGAALRVLTKIAHSDEPDDRRIVATMLAAHKGDAESVALTRALLGDSDASVRAQAAWSLGAIGDATDVDRLAALAQAREIDAAVDATAAIGRIASRLTAPDTASHALCPRLADLRAYVRANALAGLALGRARCGDGTDERRLLQNDPSDAVRASAALSVARAPTADDTKALDRCASDDREGSVARICRHAPHPPTTTHAVEVYVVSDTATQPAPHTAYALAMADGLVRAGTADRRGAVVDPVAPDGEITLRRPSALSR